MKLDLDTLSLKDLKSLQALVALAELPSKAEDLGFSLAEMTGANIVLKRAPAIPRYANPNKKAKKGQAVAARQKGLAPQFPGECRPIKFQFAIN